MAVFWRSIITEDNIDKYAAIGVLEGYLSVQSTMPYSSYYCFYGNVKYHYFPNGEKKEGISSLNLNNQWPFFSTSIAVGGEEIKSQWIHFPSKAVISMF